MKDEIRVRNTEKLVSVIIPTKNSARILPLCLESIKSQTYSTIEILVVDNYSTDNTKDIVKRYGASLFLKGNERSSQINYGAKFSKGDFIYRIDSDVIAEPNIISEAVNACESGYDGVIIRILSDPQISFWSRVRALERDPLYSYDTSVAVRFVKTTVFKALNGFDETLFAFEDYDFHNRFIQNGYKYSRIKSKEMHLGEPTRLGEVVIKHFYYGKVLMNFIRKNWKYSRGRMIRQLSPLKRGNRKRLSIIRKDPAILFGYLIYQYIRYVSSIFGFFAASF